MSEYSKYKEKKKKQEEYGGGTNSAASSSKSAYQLYKEKKQASERTVKSNGPTNAYDGTYRPGTTEYINAQKNAQINKVNNTPYSNDAKARIISGLASANDPINAVKVGRTMQNVANADRLQKYAYNDVYRNALNYALEQSKKSSQELNAMGTDVDKQIYDIDNEINTIKYDINANNADRLKELENQRAELSRRRNNYSAYADVAKSRENQALIDSGEYREAGSDQERINQLNLEYNRLILNPTPENLARVKEIVAERNQLNSALSDYVFKPIKQGYLNTKYGAERFADMINGTNTADETKALLDSEEFKYVPTGKTGRNVIGASEQIGQHIRQWTDPEVVMSTLGAGAAAAVAGQLGPQAMIPEEIVTVPGAMTAAFAVSNATLNGKVEAAQAYDELIENGIDEDTAMKVALVVGGVNAGLEYFQTDELIKSMGLIEHTGVSKSVKDVLLKEITDRALGVASEAAQEVMQESSTILGTQVASEIQYGRPAYSMNEISDRLKDTWWQSIGSFGVLAIPGATISTVRGISSYNNVNTISVADAAKIGKSLENKGKDSFANEKTYEASREVIDAVNAMSIKEAAGETVTHEDKARYAEAMSKMKEAAAEGRGAMSFANMSTEAEKNDIITSLINEGRTEDDNYIYTLGKTNNNYRVHVFDKEQNRLVYQTPGYATANEAVSNVLSYNELGRNVSKAPVAENVVQTADMEDTDFLQSERQKYAEELDNLSVGDKLVYDGEDIGEITSVKDGVATFTAKDGSVETITADSVSNGYMSGYLELGATIEKSAETQNNSAMIADRASQYGEKSGKVYADNYNGQDVVDYDENMKKAYLAGKNGKSLSSLESDRNFNEFYNENRDAVDAMYRSAMDEYVETIAKKNTEEQNAVRSREQGRNINLDRHGKDRTSVERYRRIQEERRAELRNIQESEVDERQGQELDPHGTDKAVKVLSGEWIKAHKWAKKIIADNARFGIKTILIMGDMEVEAKGEVYNVRGLNSNDGKTIIISVDNELYTAEQLNRHERFHTIVKQNEGILDDVRAKLADYTDSQLNDMSEQYAVQYKYVIGNQQTAEEFHEFIMEEIYADIYADMYIPVKEVRAAKGDIATATNATVAGINGAEVSGNGETKFSKSGGETYDEKQESVGYKGWLHDGNSKRGGWAQLKDYKGLFDRGGAAYKRARVEISNLKDVIKNTELKEYDLYDMDFALAKPGITYKIVPNHMLTPSMRDLYSYNLRKGVVTYFVFDDITVIDDGREGKVFGLRNDNSIVLKADSIKFPVFATSRHEVFHTVSNKENLIVDILNELSYSKHGTKITQEEFNKVLIVYEKNLHYIERFMKQFGEKADWFVYDEIFADAYAGHNEFLGKDAEFDDIFERMSLGVQYTTDTKGVFSTRKAKFSKSINPTQTDTEYLNALKSNDEAKARNIIEKAAESANYTIRAYHGTGRADRVGNTFRPDRATSGPMAFFTSDKSIAEGYAKDKRDTSIEYDKEYDGYENQFRAKSAKSNMPIHKAWGYIPMGMRGKLEKAAGQVRANWDGDGELIVDPNTNEAGGGFQYQLKEYKHNVISALEEQWLNSGNLFDEEEKFLDVLKLTGITDELEKLGFEVKYMNPNYREEKVYDVFLKITNPFKTEHANEKFINGYEKWAETNDYTQNEDLGADLWDKNGVTVEDFADRMRSDLKNGWSHAWTSIPDSMTEYLKSLGYDGIRDAGGKYGGASHTVWIPFSSEQVKSAETVTYDNDNNIILPSERFNDVDETKKKDIRFSKSYNGYAPVFYSKLQQEVENYKGDKIGADSAVKYLTGRGVKEEEIKWSGIRTFLEGKKSVSKAELMDYLKANEFKIDEKTLDGTETTRIFSDDDDRYVSEEEFIQLAIDASGLSNAQAQFYEHPGGNVEVYVTNPQGDDFSYTGHYDTVAGDTNWSDWKLDGGTNYREILFKIPNSDYSNRAMGTHWKNEKGVLAHARVQDIYTPDKKKVLFVEEIQSDWHNAGRKEGYTYEKIKITNENSMVKLGHENGKDGYILYVNYNPIDFATIEDIEEWGSNPYDLYEVKEYMVQRYEENNEAATGSVPDAPFSKNYTDYVLKVLLRQAAEGGYDYLAWTTADMQDERWANDDPHKEDEGKSGFLKGYKVEYDQDIPKFLNKYGKQWGAKVSDIEINSPIEKTDTSKDAYERARFEWEDAHGEAYTISETGESYGDYDDMEYDIRDIVYSKGFDWLDVEVEDYGDHLDYVADGLILARVTVNEEFPSYNDWVADIEHGGETLSKNAVVPSIQINDEMKESVLYKGQARFSKAMDSDGKLLSDEQQEFFAESKIRDADGNLKVMYHGTRNGIFNVFDETKVGTSTDSGWLGRGFYFTDKKRVADYYAGYLKTSNVKEVYLDVKNPFIFEGKLSTDNVWDRLADATRIRKDTFAEQSAEFTKWLKDNGYDGAIAKNAGEVMVLNPEQIKLTTNKRPSSSKDIRFSKAIDSDGKILTQAQQEFFKDSKLRDDNGNLKVVYHGSSNAFTVFDKSAPVKHGRVFGDGFYFTSDKERAKNWGFEHVYKCYLNITNPYYASAEDTIPDNVLNLLKESSGDIYDRFSKDPSWWGNKYTRQEWIDEEVRTTYKNAESAFSHLVYREDLPAELEGDAYYRAEAQALTRIFKSLGYDGIIYKDSPKNFALYGGEQYVAFDAEQIKLTSNKKPTQSNDVRFSKATERNAMEELENRVGVTEGAARRYETLLASSPELRTASEKLSRALSAANYSVVKEDVKSIAKDIMDYVGSKAAKSKVTGMLSDFYQYIHDQDRIDGAEITRISHEIADLILKDSDVTYDPYMVQDYENFKSELKKYKIKITPDIIEAFGDKASFADFRKANRNTIQFAADGTDIDDVYTAMQRDLPGVLGEDVNYGADQMNAILDALARLEPTPILQGEDYDLKVQEVADKIYSAYFDARFNAIANVKDARTYIKEYNDAIVAFKQKERERNDAYYESLKKKNDRRFMEYQQKVERRIGEARAYNDKQSAKKTIISDVKALSRWMTNPTDKQHVPEALRKPLANFLSYIDFSTDWKNQKGEDTQRTLAWRELKDAWKNISESQSNEDNSGYYEIDPDIVATMEELSGKIQTMQKLEDLTFTELRDLRNVIKSMKKTIENANKMVASARGATVDEISKGSMDELRTFRTYRNWTGFVGTLKKLTWNQMLSADTRFHMFGKMAEETYRAIREGFNLKVKHTREAADYFAALKERLEISDKEIREWGNGKAEDIKITTAGGKEISLRPAQVMSLYELWKRPQARLHITDGGVVTNNVQTVGKVLKEYVKTLPVKLNENDVKALTDQLTQKQKDFADGVTRYFLTTAEWGNRASMLMFGYRKFEDKNYFRIKVSQNSTHTKSDGDVKADRVAIKDAGFTKELKPKAKNPLILEDIVDVFTEQVNGMSNYDAFLAPMSDLLKWFNYVDENGISIKDEIERAYGKDAVSYVKRLIADINGYQNLDTYFAGKMVGLMKGAAVGANLSVAIQQPTAYARALAVMDAKYLMKGLSFGKATVGDWENVLKYSMIAQWKAWGFYETDIGKSMRTILTSSDNIKAVSTAKDFKEWLNTKQMVLAEKGDEIAWMGLWKASEAQVEDTTDLKPGTEEFYKEVARVFDNIIDRTQVVDSLFSRADVMRSSNDLTRMATSFMNEPMKSFNSLAWAMFDAQTARTDTAKKAAGKKLGQAVMGFLVANILAAAAKSLVSALRDKDKDKAYIDRWADAFAEETISNLNPLGYIPYIKDIVSIFQGYDVERADMTAWTDIYNMFKRFTSDNSKYTIGSNLVYGLKAISTLTGIGYFGLYRDFDALLTEALYAMDAQEAIYRKQKLLGTKIDKDASTYAKMALKAYASGNSSLGDEIVQDMIDSGASYEAIRNAMGAESKKDANGETISNSEKMDFIEKTLKYSKDATTASNAYRAAYPKDKLFDDWVSKNYAGTDYMRHLLNLQKFTGDKKQEQIVKYIKDNVSGLEKQMLVWQMAGYQLDSSKDGVVTKNGNFNSKMGYK